MLIADGMPRLLPHWEWSHVFGIIFFFFFFAWVAPSGPGTSVLCPCPGVLHPSYVLAISRDVGKASGHCVTFSPGLLTGCLVCVCTCLCIHVCECVVMALAGPLLSSSLLHCSDETISKSNGHLYLI